MVFRRWQIEILSLTLLFSTACVNPLKQIKTEKRNIPVVLHNGDIAFRRGMGAASRAVLLANTRGSYSHVGVVVNIDDEWYVLHEVPYESESLDQDQICKEPIEIFLGGFKASSGAIYRLNGIDSTQRDIVYNYVMRQMAKNTPFDHDYDLSDSCRQYCSEMVWRSYLEAGVDLSEGRRTKVSMPGFAGVHIMPADIEHNQNLEPVFRF